MLRVILRRHHLGLFVASGGRRIAVLVFVSVVGAGKVGWAFVLVGTAMVLVAGNEIMHVGRRVFVELLVVAKYEDGDVDRAKNGELVSLLEETTFALQKSN